MSPTLDNKTGYSTRWKGKTRQVSEGIEGGLGGKDGVVLPLKMVGGGLFEASYVIELEVGSSANSQKFSLQVDSGSSDLWITSSSCSTSTCKTSGARLYNPSTTGASPSGIPFSITYLRGHVEGPIFWETVNLGGYPITNQALSAASIVDDEPLSASFNGILGLALPLNSVIAQRIANAPIEKGAPDGAAWAANLFFDPTNSPSAHFLSMSLGRVDSNRIPSTLGIGRHPAGLVPDPSLIQYSSLVTDPVGTLFWKAMVRDITIYVEGLPPNSISLPRGGSGSAFPNAIVDSGIPFIFTTSRIANPIYGALGISPSADGQYYVPCNKPLNITIQLDDRDHFPLHPLDLTAPPTENSQAEFCVGLIQVADAQLGGINSMADIILGVPFMRNVYTVMAYAPPNDDGSFTATTSSSGSSSGPVAPRLGLMSLTDADTAMNEFRTVRILKQRLGNGTSISNPTVAEGSSGLEAGVIAAIAVAGVFIAGCLFFGLRWFIARKREQRLAKARDNPSDTLPEDVKMELDLGARLGMGQGGYQLAVRPRAVGMESDGSTLVSHLSEHDKQDFELSLNDVAKRRYAQRDSIAQRQSVVDSMHSGKTLSNSITRLSKDVDASLPPDKLP